MRYIVMLSDTANTAFSQNKTKVALLSHDPTSPIPYWTMLISMVPNETAVAGAKRDSVGWVNEFLKVAGKK
jgi:hypothetical protein